MPRDGDGYSRGQPLIYDQPLGVGWLSDGRPAVLIGKRDGGVIAAAPIDAAAARRLVHALLAVIEMAPAAGPTG